jgi:hypothetical protein
MQSYSESESFLPCNRIFVLEVKEQTSRSAKLGFMYQCNKLVMVFGHRALKKSHISEFKSGTSETFVGALCPDCIQGLEEPVSR